tara:strand:- start:285 stop:2543 length:2259 start_codon:yes stop_codon:yes gene_type:complete
MTNIIKIFKNISYLVIIFFIVTTSKTSAKIYKDIVISGNQRLSIETIIMFSGLETDVNIDKQELNKAIKKLYKTNYFSDIKISSEGEIIKIEVSENPIIQSIRIDGIKNQDILKQLYKFTKKKEKYPFLKNQIKDQKNLLLNIVRSTGFYFAEIDTIVIDNRNNSVDVLYTVNLGKRAKIKKIIFQGNKIFRDSKLRNIIKSEEGKFWKFITSNKYLDERKILNDENLLKIFYQNKGFYNVNVKSSYVKNVNNEFFELIFNIDAGNKFFFNNIVLDLDNDLDKQNFLKIQNKANNLKGEKYSPKKLKKIIEEIDKIVLEKEFLFLNTKYDTIITEDNKINIKLKLEDLEKLYIEQINIFGNFVTEEKVIRNSLIIDEGDAFNEMLYEKSINNIKSRGIFRSVNSNVATSKMDKQKKIIDIEVEETPTGEIFAGAGTGTSGSSISAGIKEKNYLGKGISLTTNLSIAEDQIKGKFSVINPNFRNSDRSLNTTIESTSSDFLNTGGFKTSRTGFGVGTGFEQYSDFFVNFDVSAYYEKLETSSTASAYKKKQEGDYFENLFTYNLTLNKLDQNFQSTDGYKVSLQQILPIYSDDLSIGNTINFAKFHSISDNLILSGKLFFKSINSIDDDVRVSRRVYIPSSKLRGFEAGKFGPKDGDEYVGGNFGTAINIDTTLPNILSGYENIDLSLFLDAASLREVDYDSSLESSQVRSSTGISVNWYTVVGPLSFSYAIPLSSEPSDKTESFRFRLGTSF